MNFSRFLNSRILDENKKIVLAAWIEREIAAIKFIVKELCEKFSLPFEFYVKWMLLGICDGLFRNNIARGGYVYDNRLRTAAEPNDCTQFYYTLGKKAAAAAAASETDTLDKYVYAYGWKIGRQQDQHTNRQQRSVCRWSK